MVDRDELLSAFPEKQAPAEVLRALIDARLVTSYEVEGKEGEPSHHRVEVVHESLLKAWPRLVRWQAQDEEGALLRDQLKQAAHLWQEKSRSPDLLWSGTSFREYELWRERYQGQLTALEEQFAKAMTDRARRTRRLRQAAVVAVVIALSVVAIVVSWSRQQAAQARDEARAAARRAEASRLVALGKLELETEPTLTLAYARKSLEVHDSSEARRLALEALWRGPTARVLPIAKDADGCIWVWPSPDGQWLACSNWGSVITLVSADGKTTRLLPNNRNAARNRIVLFSDDSRRLATFAPGDPETVVWSLEGEEVARFQPGGFPRRFVGDEVVLILEPRRTSRSSSSWPAGSEAPRRACCSVSRWGPSPRIWPGSVTSTRGTASSSRVRWARPSRPGPASSSASTTPGWPTSTSTRTPDGSSRSTSGGRSASGTGRRTDCYARCRASIPTVFSGRQSSTPAEPFSRGTPCASAPSPSGTSPGRRTRSRCSCARARSRAMAATGPSCRTGGGW